MDPLQIDTVNRNNLTVNDFSKYGRYLLDIRSWSVNINIYFLTLLQNHKVVHSYLPKACRFKLCRNKSIYIHDLFNRHQKNCYLRTFYWVNRFQCFFWKAGASPVLPFRYGLVLEIGLCFDKFFRLRMYEFI